MTAKSTVARKKRLYRDGLRVFRVTVDPVDLLELLHEAGVVVANNAKAEELSQCLTDLIARWHDGRLGLLVRDSDIPEDDGPA